MRRQRLILMLAILFAIASPAPGQEAVRDDQQALRQRLAARFDVLPLADGVALRPKSPVRDVRLIEVSDVIAINGTPVSGQELRERLGRDAELVLRLSYLDAEARRALVQPAPAVPEPPPLPPVPEEPGIEAPRPDEPREPRRRNARSHGDRVRVFGSVAVGEDESINGQAVAVLGSAYIDGEVGDQVVAVLGSVHLGPKSIVRGDVVAVGGQVRRAPGAQVRGSVTEVALGGGGMRIGEMPPGPWFAAFAPFPFFFDGPARRFTGTIFRLTLLLLLAAVVLVLSRRTVEGAAARLSDNPGKSALVGIAALVLTGPVLLLTCLVLAITIIGIPVIFVLMPVAVLALVVLAIVGFTGTAYAVGQLARRRFGATTPGAFVDVAAGVLVILLPLLVGRMLGFAGWAVAPFAMVLVGVGVVLELIAWVTGFGAVITNAFTGWQARRTA